MEKRWGFIDFDNTMMATESKALPSLIKRFNILYGKKLKQPLTAEQYNKLFHGQARQDLCIELSKFYGIPVLYEELYADREWNIMQLYAEEGVEMAPNILSAFEELSGAGTVFSFVSNNPVQRGLAAMRYATNHEGNKLASFFGTRFFESGDKPKPLPDVYWHAVAQVKADVRQSFAVEDSVTGIRSAVAAGLRTYGYVGLSEKSKELAEKLLDYGAIAVFEDWKDFPSLVSVLD